MARIIYGSIITDIKGSIGGITFQKNASGQVARLKPRKNKTNTQKQRDQQPRLKGLQREWNLLSLTNKILWNDFGVANNKIGLDGQEKTLTGYQWFLTINENRLLFDDSILSAPPVYEIVNPISGGYLTYTSNILRFNYNEPLGGVDSRVSVWASFVINSASKFDFNLCRNFRNYNGISDTGQNINILQNGTSWQVYYNSVFPPQLGNKSFYLLAYVRFIGLTSGISSLAYTTISKFVWDGAKYVIE